MTVPQYTGEGAEKQVISPDITLGIVAPSVVLLILLEAIEGIGDETSNGHEQNGG